MFFIHICKNITLQKKKKGLPWMFYNFGSRDIFFNLSLRAPSLLLLVFSHQFVYIVRRKCGFTLVHCRNVYIIQFSPQDT